MAAAGNRALAVRALSLCHAGGVPGWAGDIHRLVLVTLTMAGPMRAELPPRVVIRHGRLVKKVSMSMPVFLLPFLTSCVPSAPGWRWLPKHTLTI